ncbi:MAG: ribonuclease D [Gammaproteobacteria bacterium]|nr:ribonuclease D [Gammaproteobacteria bacterium]MBT3725197.1 ribonuclease D [Gammaproteobacteria bacterium]MBT4076334.1 ribonuclease D [Gammaproteobacteria bacterium]MBT4194197.1 ribonuclease D [Gammaproteobacteria bacterium]MBT4450493.1 ribonuclease D [Gammaproteobacteria bacterium]
MKYHYIDSNQALKDFCFTIQSCKYCALDTEFIREKTYFPLLALIQLATETEQACIDPLAIDDFSPLVEIFQNTSMVKILHSPSQDLELFFQQFDALPEPVFDTQLAAAVLGYANQIGYADLVNRKCGVQLEKKYTRADWSRRPLSDGELDYAMDDVRYLIQMYETMKDELESRDRWSWIQADFQKMSDKAVYQLDMTMLWKKLRGVQKLKGAALNNADQLCRWREQLAINKNRPKRWMLKDEDLIDIARFKPVTHNDLKQIGNLSADYIKKNGDAILKVIKEASLIDSSQYPKLPEFVKLNIDQQATSDCLMAICRVVAEKNKIALASVTTKKEIDQLVAGKVGSKITTGWRNEMIGKYLLQFLNGEISLSCVNGQLEYS